MNFHYSLIIRKPLVMGAALITVFITAFAAWSVDSTITTENGLLEVAQDVLLIMACLFHVYHGKNSRATLGRYLRFGLALFCFAILLREFDIDNIGRSPVWQAVETLVRGTTVIALLIYLALSLKKIRLFWENRKTIFTSPTMVLTLVGCIIYLSGWPFDKMIFPIAGNFSVFLEETLELAATLLLLLSSIINSNTESLQLSSPIKPVGNCPT